MTSELLWQVQNRDLFWSLIFVSKQHLLLQDLDKGSKTVCKMGAGNVFLPK